MMTAKRRVLIVDSGMRNAGGHNFSYTQAVEHSLASSGLIVDVLASRHLAPDLARESGYRPVFSIGAYDFAPGNGALRDLGYVVAQSVVFAAELERYLASVDRGSYAALFSHTLHEFELLGWRRALRRC